MRTVTLARQGTLDGRSVLVRRNVFDRPVDELRELVEEAQVECFECGARGRVGRRMVALEVYDDPWQEEPTIIHVCHWRTGLPCADRLTDTSWADFRYFLCEWCYRLVIRQCPRNGWHSYVRVVNECEEVCLRCYEESIYDQGLPREEFEVGEIPGMFFNRGDLEKHGFSLVDGFEDWYAHDEASTKALCDEALRLIDAGYQVAVDYERLGIGGGEGYVSLYARKGA